MTMNVYIKYISTRKVMRTFRNLVTLLRLRNSDNLKFDNNDGNVMRSGLF